MVRHRRLVLLGWLVLFVFGAAAATNVGSLLSNRFSVPGSDAERAYDTLKTRFGERGDGAFTLVVQSAGGRVNRAAVERRQPAAPRCCAAVNPGPF